MVQFKHEDPQTGSRTIDIGIHGLADVTLIGAKSYSIYESFLVIEGKRLPAPDIRREREYVTGKSPRSDSPTGGIQRYKLCLHGAFVDEAILVGYIQEENAPHWHVTINEWITELVDGRASDGCVWDTTETLQALAANAAEGTAASESIHPRVNGRTEIKIHHFWVSM